jgi:hypothetical protein
LPLQIASAPHPEDLNKEALFLCKGDIFAGETKQAREPTSTLVRAVYSGLRLGGLQPCCFGAFCCWLCGV